MEQAEALQDDFVPEETAEVTEVAEGSQEEVEEIETNEDETEVAEEPEFVEIEYNGEKYSVPPELKDAVMRQSDYTTKTQEVSEQRRALEAQQQQFEQVVQAQQRNLQGHAQLAALQSQLEQYSNVNWSQFSEEDPASAQQAFFQYQQLKDASQNLSQQIQQQEQVALQEQRNYYAKRLEQGKAELARDIPDWSPAKAAAIAEHGRTYGFEDSELQTISDPRMVKALHDAMMYRQSLKKATTPPQTKAKPAAKVRGKATVQKDPDKMTSDEWLKWRNKQIAS